MLRLILFEIRKNYLNKYMITFFLLLIILNVFVIYQGCIGGDEEFDYFMPHDSDTKNQWDFYQKMHEKLDGELTIEKIYFVTEEFSRLSEIVNQKIYSTKYQADTYTGYIFGDYHMIKDYFYKPMKYATLYETEMNQIVEKAKENVDFYTLHANRFEKEKNQVILNKYAGRSITVFYDTKTWEKLFRYQFSDLLILCLMLLGLVPIFVHERETRMDALILSSQKGRVAMTFAKVLSSFIFIAFLGFVFAGINFLEFKMLYGLNGSGLPLYVVEAFQYTPLNCSVGVFYCLITLLKVIGLFSFGSFICLCSSVFQRVIYPYMLSVLFLVFGLYASGYLTSLENGKMWISLISPFTLMKGEQLYSNLLGCNLANMFFLRVNVCVVIQVAIIIMLFLLLCFFGTKMDFKIKQRYFKREVS